MINNTCRNINTCQVVMCADILHSTVVKAHTITLQKAMTNLQEVVYKSRRYYREVTATNHSDKYQLSILFYRYTVVDKGRIQTCKVSCVSRTSNAFIY